MKVELEIVKFNLLDVVTASPGGGNTTTPDCLDPLFT